MNVSRAIIENMIADQKALDAEIDQLAAKLAAAVAQKGQNDAHLLMARKFAALTPEGAK